MKKFVALGLMSGTSMDGIDVAMIETDGHDHVVRGAEQFFPYDGDLRLYIASTLKNAREITERTARPGKLKEVEKIVTQRHGEAVNQFLSMNGLSASDIDVIGFHGQTVVHRPDLKISVQLGNGQKLANATGIDVVYDMRANDMVHGGQGAPLVPVYHRALSRTISKELVGSGPICFVNIGGISNLTYIDWDNDDRHHICASDSGPGNSLIDQWVQQNAGIPYDAGGAIASEGQLIQSLADDYLSKPFFDMDIPKSLDRGDFTPPPPDAASLEDGANSLGYVTAAGILKTGSHLPRPPSLWIICGGGRLNKVIMNYLRQLINSQGDGAKLVSADEAGFNGDSMEAEAWGYLAVRSMLKLPLTYPGTTGCDEAVTGGILAKAKK